MVMEAVLPQALPVPHLSAILSPRDGLSHPQPGESVEGRTLCTMLSMMSMLILSFLLGTRYAQLRRNLPRKRTMLPILVLLLYAYVLMFTIITAVLVSGQGLWTHGLCRASTWACVVFYSSVKAVISIYLVECIHIVRAPFYKRRHDRVYLGCMIMIAALYCAVIINGYIYNFSVTKVLNGKCYIGIRRAISIPFTAVNVFIDIALALVFFSLLQPTVAVRTLGNISRVLGTKSMGHQSTQHPSQFAGPASTVQQSIIVILRKSVIGSVLIGIPKAANLAWFVIGRVEERGVLCLSLCLLEVVWDCIVVHWLTFGSTTAAAEKDLLRSTNSHGRTVLTRDMPETTRARNDQDHDPKPRVGVLHVIFEKMFKRPENVHLGVSNGPRQDSAAALIAPGPQRWPGGGV